MATMERSFSTKFHERLRYGLGAQEALDRLTRIGLIYYPYYLVAERAREEPATNAEHGTLTVATLGPEQARLVAEFPCRPLNLDRVVERMRATTCHGVFYRGELAGYSWADFSAVRAPLTLVPLFALDERSVYLLDMYVARAHRGKRLAPWLRYQVYREVMRAGRDKIYSITFVNNQSSRRFKARLGAIEIEKRLVVGIKSLIAYDTRRIALTQEPLPSVAAFTHRGKLPTG
jgi:hypothetical protein